MKNISRSLTILLLLAFVSTSCGPLSKPTPTYSNTLTTLSIPTIITYVGNSGFLIAVGDKKILIDSLYEAFPHGYQILPSIMERMMNASPPFDNIDLVLATHRHSDHFSVKTVRQYLEKFPEVTFASTAQITGMLTEFGDRVITLDAKSEDPDEVNIDGIELKAIYLSHGIPSNGMIETINNAYLITIQGITIFQTGDIDPSLLESENLQNYQLSEKNIDIALIQHYILSDPNFLSLVNDLIKSRYIIPIHYEYNNGIVDWEKIKKYYPDAVHFGKEMQNWEMPQ